MLTILHFRSHEPSLSTLSPRSRSRSRHGSHAGHPPRVAFGSCLGHAWSRSCHVQVTYPVVKVPEKVSWKVSWKVGSRTMCTPKVPGPAHSPGQPSDRPTTPEA
eukprot:3748811-Rhodomonas_salina.1